MKNKLTERLQELQAEYNSGQSMLADLEQKKAALERTLLRISGAIQVLEELLASAEEAPVAGDGAGTA